MRVSRPPMRQTPGTSDRSPSGKGWAVTELDVMSLNAPQLVDLLRQVSLITGGASYFSTIFSPFSSLKGQFAFGHCEEPVPGEVASSAVVSLRGPAGAEAIPTAIHVARGL